MNRLVPTISVLALCAPLCAQETEAPERPVISLRVPIDDPAQRTLELYPTDPFVDAILDVQQGVDVLEPSDRGGAARGVVRALRDAIRTFVEPAFDDDEEVQALGSQHLAVLGRPEQHAWVRRFLELQKASAGQIATVQIEILKLTPATFAELGIGAEPRVLDGPATQAFRRKLRGADGEVRDGVDWLTAPAVATFPLQRAQVSALNQVAYVKDFEVLTLDDGTKIVDPKVDVAKDGITLDGSFATLPAHTYGLTWKVHVADLLRPIPTFQTQLGAGGQPVSIQLPNVATADFEAKVVLPEGSTAVLPAPELRGKRLVVLLSARLLEAPPGRSR